MADVPVRRRELLAVLSIEWQSSTVLRKLTGAPTHGILLAQLHREGVVERRGVGRVGDPFEWRLTPHGIEVQSA